MDNNKIHIIFPKDESTNFLQEIIDYLIDEVDANLKVHRLETAKEHDRLLSNIDEDIPEGSLIIFMAHGTSTAISGASTSDYSHPDALIQNEQLSVFKNRKVVLLTCRSNEYLKTYFNECNLSAAIGFPNLITDDLELVYPEQPERVSGVSKSDIIAFRELLVGLIKFSVEDLIKYDLPFYQLYTRIQTRVQRALAIFYEEQPGNTLLPLGKMIYDLNKGLCCFGN